MKRKIVSVDILVFISIVIFAGYFIMPAATETTWIMYEDFSSPVLDPSWTVLSDLSPNHYSLTDNPGHLRYYLAPAIWNSWPNYAYRWDEGTQYWYAPSVVLLRNFTGNNWILKTKVTYDFSVERNGRQQEFYIVWKHDGTRKLTYFTIWRDNDVDWWNRNSVNVMLYEEGELLDHWRTKLPMFVLDTHYFEVTREEKTLTIRYSEDDQNWVTVLSATMTSDLGDLQTITIEADSWKYTSAGDYAEFDYIHVESLAISATVDIDPDTLNLESIGEWITTYIELSEGYDVADIKTTTILLNGTISPVLDPKYEFVTNSSEYIVDHDGDGVLERMVKFNRTDVASWIYTDLGIEYGNVTLTITGELFDGTQFEGSDTANIFLINLGDIDGDGDVDADDFYIFAGAYGSSVGDPAYKPEADLDSDGDADADDFYIFSGNYGKTYS